MLNIVQVWSWIYDYASYNVTLAIQLFIILLCYAIDYALSHCFHFLLLSSVEWRLLFPSPSQGYVIQGYCVCLIKPSGCFPQVKER